MATMETYRHPPESPYSHPHPHPHPHPQPPHHRHSFPSHPHSYPHHHHQRHPSSDLSSHHLPYLRPPPPPPTHNRARDGAWPHPREEVTKRGQIENTPPSPVESQHPHPQARVPHHHYHHHQQQSNLQESPRVVAASIEAKPSSSSSQYHPSHYTSQPHSRRRDEMPSPPLPLPHQYAHAPLEHQVLRPTHAERPQHPQTPPTQQQQQQQQQPQQRSMGQFSEQGSSEYRPARQSFVHPQEQRTPMQSPPSLAPRPSQQPQTVPHLPQQQQQQQQQPPPPPPPPQKQQQQQKPRTREQLEHELIQHEMEQKERWQQRKKIQAAQAAEKQRALDEKLRRQEEYLQWDLQRQKQIHQAKTKLLKEEERRRKAAREQELAQQRMHAASSRPMDTELPPAPTSQAPYLSQPSQPRPAPAGAVSSSHHPHYQHYQGPIDKIEPSLKRPRESEGPRPLSTHQQPSIRSQGQYRPPSPREHQSWPRSASPLSRKGSTVSLSKLSLEEEGGVRPHHQSTASWSEPSSLGARGPRMTTDDQHLGYPHNHVHPPTQEQPHPPRPTQNSHHLSFHHHAQPSPKLRSLQRPKTHSPMDIASPPPPAHMQQDMKRIKVGERTREHWDTAATAPSTPILATRPEIKRPLSYEYYGSSSLQRSPSQGSRRATRRQSATVTQPSSSLAHAPAPPVFSSRPHSPVGLPPVHPVRPLPQPPHSRHYPSPPTPDSSRPPYLSGNESNNNNNSFQPRNQPKEHWNTSQPIMARDRMPHPSGVVAHGQGQGRNDRENWEQEESAPELRPPSKEPAVVRGGGGAGSQQQQQQQLQRQQRPTTFFPGSSSELGFHPSHQTQQRQQHQHQQQQQQQQQFHHGHPNPYPQHHGHF